MELQILTSNVVGDGVTGAGVTGAGVTGAGVTGAGVTGAGVVGCGRMIQCKRRLASDLFNETNITSLIQAINHLPGESGKE